MPSTNVFCGILFQFLTIKLVSPVHILLLWEHKDFFGESSYVLTSNNNCVTLIPEWKSRASSLNTNRHCYQLFEGSVCDGKSVFVYPMSKSHNDLAALGINDKINSVKLCLLDEKSLETPFLPLNKTGSEYVFWDNFFGRISVGQQNAFRHVAGRYNYSYIPWNFIPGIKSTTSLAEQYQLALDWVIDTIQGHKFSIADLTQMRKLAYRVFDDRANRNAVRNPRYLLGTREDAITFQLEIYWKMIVEAIDNKVEKILDEEELRKLISKTRKHPKSG